jgi:hypothetical protein
MNLVLAADERYQPGHVLPFDVARQDSMHPLEPRLGETAHAHARLLAQVRPRLFSPGKP